MSPAKDQLSGHGPDKGQKHIPLGIPGIALGAEKIGGCRTSQKCRPPFDKFIAGADGETGTGNQEKKPFPGSQR